MEVTVTNLSDRTRYSDPIRCAEIKTRAEGHDGTRGEGRGRPRVAATDDQEQGQEGEGHA